MSLGIEDILEVLGDAQEAGVIDLQGYVSLTTRFTKDINAQRAALTAAGNVPPSDLRPSTSEPIAVYAPPKEVERPQGPPERRAKGVGVEVLAYPPDESGQEPPLATF